MRFYEFEAKQVLGKVGVPMPKRTFAHTPEEAEAITRELGGSAVIKAQAHTGARGKAGGVKVAKTPEEAKAQAPRSVISKDRSQHSILQFIFPMEQQCPDQ